MQRAAEQRGKAVDAAHHTLRPLGEGVCGAVRRGPTEGAIGRATDLDARKCLASGQGEVIGLAAFDIGQPIGQFEIIVAAR